jgi:hypothetical protein
MEIYFSCSITGGRKDEPAYQAIVAALQADGHQVPTAILAFPDVMHEEVQVSAAETYARDMGWLAACDAVVAEVSTPSHGVGYEIASAVAMEKPVICGCRQGARVSKMISGDPHIVLVEYTEVTQYLSAIRDFLARIELTSHPGGNIHR